MSNTGETRSRQKEDEARNAETAGPSTSPGGKRKRDDASEGTTLEWREGKDFSKWAHCRGVAGFLSGGDLSGNETDLQRLFFCACNALAFSGSSKLRAVQAFRFVGLKTLHGANKWEASVPYNVYRKSLDSEMSENSITEASSRSSKSVGPTAPDFMIAARVNGSSHAVWVCEMKHASNPSDWKGSHKKALTQALFYLYATNEMCRASMGLVVVNDRFQRLLAVNGKGGQPDLLIIEVPRGKEQEEPMDNLKNYEYGEDSIPNLLSSLSESHEKLPESATKDVPLVRLWQHLKTALEVAEKRAESASPCDESHAQRIRPTQEMMPNIALFNQEQTIRDAVEDTETASDAVKRARSRESNAGTSTRAKQRRGSGGGGRDDGQGPGRRRRQGGEPGGGGGGKGGGRKIDVDDTGNAQPGNRQEAVPPGVRPKQPDPLGPFPEQKRTYPNHSLQRYVQGWLRGQRSGTPGGSTPDRSESDDEDSTITPPSIATDNLAGELQARGWRLQLVSPHEMDRRVLAMAS